MSFTKVIHESEAAGELKEVYQRTLARLSPSVRQRRGDKLPPIVKIFSLCPALLEARVGFDKGIYRPNNSGLGRRKEELIATQVAALSGCRFWGIGHGEFLRVDGKMAVEEVAKVITNWRGADLDEQEKAMLAFTEKFTLTPSEITDDDVESLRCAGFSEEQILAIGLGAGYRNWVDRIADLLGVEEEKFDFPEEILKAFRVTREQLRTSLYEDQQWAA